MRTPILYLCAAVVLSACSTITIDEKDVLYPKPSVTPETFDLKQVTLSNEFIAVEDSISVNAWHVTHDDPVGTVLFFGGNGFYLVQSRGYLRALTRPSVNAVLWDYRGYGRSEGTPNVQTLRHDAIAVYDSIVAQKNVQPERLLVWGHSLGSFLAMHVASERDVAGVVLENPITTADDWVSHLVPWYIRLFVGFDVSPALKEENNLERIRRMDVPLLVVGGSDDNVTDADMARTLHEAAGTAQKELIVVEGGGHNELYDDPRVERAYRTLVERVFNSPRSTPAGSSGE